MKWPWLLFVGWLVIFPHALAAEEYIAPDSIPILSLPQPSLLRHNTSARFYLVLGRLQLDPVRYRKGSQTLLHASATSATQPLGSPAPESPPTASLGESTGESTGVGTSETLQVTSHRGIPSIHYSMTNNRYRIIIEGNGVGVWRIDSSCMGNQSLSRVVVEQHPGQPLTLQHDVTGKSTIVKAQTWLHLREIDRMLFATHLEPILAEMLWPYHFNRLADEVTDQSSLISNEAVVDDDRFVSWIEDLRSPSRIARITADRNLSKLGISLLPRLARLDRSSLDAEQKQRLARIEAKLTPATEDDSARLANLVRDDYHYWALVSNRLDHSQQQLVAARFKQLGGKQPVQQSAESIRIATGEAPRMR